MLDFAAAQAAARAMAARRTRRWRLSGSLVRCRRLPVRRDVFPRQGRGISRGAARPAAGRAVCVQRLGPHRGERIRRCLDRSRGRAVSRRPAAFSRAHAARYHDAEKIGAELGGGRVQRASTSKTVARRSRAASPRDPAIGFCQGRRCATRSRRRDPSRLAEATDARDQPRSRRASVPARSTGRYRRSWITACR